MGVFDKNGRLSHFGEPEVRPYVCMACEATFEVQYHACPVCDGYDIRRAKWVSD